MPCKYLIKDLENDDFLTDTPMTRNKCLDWLDVFYAYESDYDPELLYKTPKEFLKNARIKLVKVNEEF
jgi:hypothetical protein